MQGSYFHPSQWSWNVQNYWNKKDICSDIETILSESLGGNKCEHENIRNDTKNKLSYSYVKK